MKALWMICLLLALPVVASALSVGDTLRAGFAAVDITPPMALKASLGGYGDRMSKPAEGVHDRVWAKALVFSNGTRRFALVTADILAFPPGFKEAVVGALSAQGWQADQILLLASHSHTSIDMAAIHPNNTFNVPQIGLFNKGLFDLTVANFAKVITEASRDLVPITVGTDSITLQGWNTNRREGNSTVDPELTVTRIDRADGTPLAALVNWTAHPTFMGPDDMLFSGDWPGQMQRTVEALVGGHFATMYFNGAEGDQTKVARREGDSNWEQAERYGRELGILVWQVWKKIKTRRTTILATHIEPIALPERTWHPDFMQTGGAEYGLTPETAHTILYQMEPPTTHSIAVRLGDLMIVSVPGELAAELGLAVKAQVQKATGVRHVVIGGLADEWIGYVLSAEEYKKGGYEASMSFYGPTLGEILTQGIERGADQLRP
ncbi:MAG TPA: neutral/alkaline non-lysosomal ceramidase N-terminal domain-containing protein [Chthonomonadaceae bacterium]|nr:neutral/alkaline non-lysosomal ceramidase N-terminal domain-containing protein [Chthonomonadaceae bacterium]